MYNLGYYEYKKFGDVNITDLDIKTIEMEGDGLAATNAFYNLMHLYINFETQVQYHDMISKNQLFNLWGSTIVFVCKWIEQNIKDDRTRPTARYRAINAYHIVQDYIEISILSDEEQHHAVDGIIKGMFSADKSCRELMGLIGGLHRKSLMISAFFNRRLLSERLMIL